MQSEAGGCGSILGPVSPLRRAPQLVVQLVQLVVGMTVVALQAE